MTTEWVRRTMIVPAEKADAARALVEQFAVGQGEGMFRTGLSVDGTEPATHYVSSGSIWKEFGDILDEPSLAIAYFLDGCELANPDEESPHATFTRLGLQLVWQESQS